MGVISCELSKIGTTGSRDNTGKSAYTATYFVITDSYLDQAATVCDYFKNAGNLPYLAKPYTFGNDNDQSVVCTSIEPRRLDGSQTDWTVTFSYATPTGEKKEEDEPQKQPDRDTKELTDDPERWRESFSFGFTQISIPIEDAVYREGIFGLGAPVVGTHMPICNSAGEPFIPKPEYDLDIQTWRRGFYKRAYDTAFGSLYMGAVNTNAINLQRADINVRLVADEFCLLIKSIGADLEWLNGAPFWHYAIEAWNNPLGWRRHFADMGLNKRATPGYSTGRGVVFADGDFIDGRARLVPILDVNGDPITTPQLLDGAGGVLITNAAFPDPLYITYSVLEEKFIPENLFGGFDF